jgi:hypothetical protein
MFPSKLGDQLKGKMQTGQTVLTAVGKPSQPSTSNAQASLLQHKQTTSISVYMSQARQPHSSLIHSPWRTHFLTGTWRYIPHKVQSPMVRLTDTYGAGLETTEPRTKTSGRPSLHITIRNFYFITTVRLKSTYICICRHQVSNGQFW